MELLDTQPTVKRKKLNLKKEILKYLRYWYWILLSTIIFYVGAKIYLRYTTPQYLSKTTLQFPRSNNNGSSTLTDLETLGNGLSEISELQGETTAILAKPILSKVVGALNLNVSFYGIGAIKENELYTSSPIDGKIITIFDPNFTKVSYIVTNTGNGSFELSEGPLLKGKKDFKFGQIADLPFGRVILSNKKGGAQNFEAVKIVFRSTSSLVSSLENSLSVVLPENKGLLMEVSLKGAIPSKSRDILNELNNQYNFESVKDRNLEAQNTQNFINGRLDIISQDLSGIEGEKEAFKRKNEITDLDVQANIAVTNSNDNTKQLVAYTTQLELVNSIYNLLGSGGLLPSNMGLSNTSETYIAKYNDLLLVRNKTLKQATSQNPSVIQLNREIAEIKDLVKNNLLESKEALRLQIAQLQAQLNTDQTRIYNYPAQERIFRGIERQRNLKEQLYLYLLQKREENAIRLAVTAPKAKVLNPAYTVGVVEPDAQKILLGALLAGFLIPILVLYIKYTTDSKIYTKDQIQYAIPNATVIAEIPENENTDNVVSSNDFSVFAESFRILTSNLKFILKSNENRLGSDVILITSSVKGEGKTTIAFNTAVTLAGNSKVLIIGADIRNPQLSRFVKDFGKGLTDYLVSDDNNVDEFIVNSNVHANLDILFSGAIAPNPNDLLEMQKFDEMINDLKNTYRYIVIDSAPIMLVSDTLHLLEVSDVVLYVVKSNYTDNQMLDFADEFRNTHDLKNISFVLNNVKPQDSRYGNKYGYGYYSTKK